MHTYIGLNFYAEHFEKMHILHSTKYYSQFDYNNVNNNNKITVNNNNNTISNNNNNNDNDNNNEVFSMCMKQVLQKLEDEQIRSRYVCMYVCVFIYVCIYVCM